ncbi:nucleotidyl transferase AbiEii/AbiGii toxin family protein [Patescibacteria group bacterium]|nr:nucleotidyl transferase AbiEii/AbiGii toxin family protein [Patescibacteria group bacterium]MBU1931854.1 nucleotidyl transferase AbiEii/AbiGii toxin family protein [Patescibacteria group bacterium]
MHRKVLNKNQLDLLPLIKTFSSDFGLVGGTAIALQLGHRRSIDFDLFTNVHFNSDEIKKNLRRQHKIGHVFIESQDELTILVDEVKLTFYHYPFAVKFLEYFEDIISMSDLLTLAAMKAFALGKRAKWKDYVDLYFIFKKYQLKQVVVKSRELFKTEFNEKLFRSQLIYFKDIDYSEKINYLPGMEVKDSQVKKALEKYSLQI